MPKYIAGILGNYMHSTNANGKAVHHTHTALVSSMHLVLQAGAATAQLHHPRQAVWLLQLPIHLLQANFLLFRRSSHILIDTKTFHSLRAP